MNDYDFSTLNDKEFENITTDLLSKYLDTHVERFRTGRDGGVDGRFYSNDNNEVIIQCKHWLKSGTNALINHLKTTEIRKIKKLSPSRYILVTSVELSRANKITIKNILSPYILNDNDIIGKEDLNSLLGRFPEIEERHYKLWLSSTTILKSILNNGIFSRSASKLEEIKEKSSLYVQTDNHVNALNLLENSHVAILTGEPGVGKTTLADHLCLHYYNNGYQLVHIENSLLDADEVDSRDPEVKQIFYFDDFLGRNYLMALQRHEDSHVVNFIKRISKSKNKRFVLTSRTNIYNQGKRLSELFYIDNIDKNEYELRIDSLTDIDKAYILYNHIWFSDLSEEHINNIYKKKRYRDIIDHENYNPRLISFITDSHKISDIDPVNYWGYIKDTLNNPSEIWAHVFDQQVDSFSRILVKLINFNGRFISEDDLYEAFGKYIEATGLSQNANISTDFESTIKLVSGALINRNIDSDNNTVFYTLFNPSIGDYLLALDKRNKKAILYLFTSLDTISSLTNLKNIKNNKLISKSLYTYIINEIIQLKLSDTSLPINYRYKLACLGIGVQNITGENIINIKNFIISLKEERHHADNVSEFSDLLAWGLKYIEPDYELENYVYTENELYISEVYDHDDFVNLSYIVAQSSHEDIDTQIESLNDNIEDYWCDHIHDYIKENYALDQYHDISDENAATKDVESAIDYRLSDYYLDMSSIDIDNICSNCDVSSILYDNMHELEDRMEETMEDSHQTKHASNYTAANIDPIDDLFDRGV